MNQVTSHLAQVRERIAEAALRAGRDPTTVQLVAVSKTRNVEEIQALYDPAAEGEELMLQGVVDCAFRTEEGLVVVDFKTDRLAPGEEPQRAEEYRPQLEAYAQALERVMEEKVCRKVLYFFSTGSTINL